METDQGGILDALPVMAWTALPDGRIDFVNRHWFEYTGVGAHDPLGRNWQAVVHPDDLHGFFEGWRFVLASGQPGHVEARVRRFDGEYRRFFIQCSPIYDAAKRLVRWCGVATDVEDRRRAEEASKQRDLDFQLVVDSIPMPVAVTSPSGEVEALNQLTLDYFGKTFEELKGWKASEVVHSDDLERTIALQVAAHRDGTSYHVESRHRRADGLYRWFSVHGLPLRDSQGQIRRWLILQIDIDDRKRAEEALRESERKARAIVDNMPGFAAILTPDGKTDVVNLQMAEYHGLSQEELGKWATNGTIHGDDLPRVAEIFDRSIAGGTLYEFEYRLRRFDGVYRWFYSRGVPLRDNTGNIVCWYVLQTDIDDKKRAEQALMAREREARLIVNSIPAGLEVLSPAGKVEAVNDHLAAYLGKSQDELIERGLTEHIHPDDLENVLRTAANSFATGEPYKADQRFRGADGAYRWFQVRGLPLHDAEGNIVRWYALHIDIDEKKRADEALAASQRNLQLIIDTTPAMAWSARPDGRNEFLSKQYVEYIGLPSEQIPGWDSTRALHPDDFDRMDAFWRNLVASGMPGEGEARLRRHDGVYRWFLFRANPLLDDNGNVITWYGVSTDIDDRKRAEEALAASESESRLILDSIPARVGIFDIDGVQRSANRQAIEASGYSAGGDWRQILHPDDLESTEHRWRECLDKAEPFECEYRARIADGSYRWHLGRRVPMRDEKGKVVRWYGVSHDIEDLKRAEQALQRSERQLRLILDSIPARVGVYDIDGTRLFANKPAAELGEFSENSDWRDIYHPDDLKPAEDRWRHCLEKEKPFEFEYRARMADGTYRWRMTRRVPMRDEHGKVIRWYGATHDIEDRKRAEQALAERESELRQILDCIPVRVGVFDTNGIRVSANRQAVELSGIPGDADWREVFHPDDVELAEQLWREALVKEEPFEAEHRARMADGAYHWHLGRRVPMRDDQGRVLRWYGVSYDIEDRKRAEQALEASERELRAIIDCIPARVAVYDVDGRRVYAKPARELGGYPEGADWRDNYHPDDVGAAEDQWRACLESGEPFECEYRARMADNTYRWHLARRVPMRDDRGRLVRWYGVSHDIEELKQAEKALAASERNLQTTIDTIPVLAWSARPDGSAEFLNKHYLDYVGLSEEQAQGWGWNASVCPDDIVGLGATWQAIRASGEPGETEARLRRYDGEYRWFLFRASPLRDDRGNIVKWYGVNTDIEDRKRSEEGFRAIVETTPECVKVVARDGTVLRTNAAGAVMAGVPSVDAVIGKRFFDFVAPEHQERYIEFHEKVCAGQRGFLEFDLVNAQGIRRHMETHAAPLRESDGSIVQLGVTRDMTARKQAEDALRRSEAFLTEGQHLARMGNFSWNVTGAEIIWSEQLYRIFDFEPGDAVTLDQVASRVHPDDAPMIDDMMARAQRGERGFEYQPRIVLPDQSVKYLHLIAHRAGCHAKDGVIEYIGAVLDITQRRLSEEAVEKLRSELAQVTRIMSLGALTASIAHEVNQPLAGIVTNAGTCLRMLAADPPNVEGAQETARRTIRDGKRAADVIARLRALFTKRTATIEPVDLNDAAREVIALSSNDLQRNRVMLRTELVDELPPVAGDRVQLQQVIMNLVRNAADAMSVVNDRPRLLLVSTARDEEGQVRLSVRDAGIGFGSEGTERLFDAFYTTKSDGMGIGLSVSRSIVERHNGRLWAKANDGPGATFSFSIPGCSGDAIMVQDAAANAVGQHGSV